MKNSKKGFIGIPALMLIIFGLVITGSGAYFIIHKKPISKSTSKDNLNTLEISTTTNKLTISATSSALSTINSSNQNLIHCGSVDQKILTQYDYQPTETEKKAIIKSLTCINQALIRCSPASLVINNTNKITNITVKGQQKLGCNVDIKKYTGEVTACPLPPDYVVGLQKKFTLKNFDVTIINHLITDINVEISTGNKSGTCTVTNN